MQVGPETNQTQKEERKSLHFTHLPSGSSFMRSRAYLAQLLSNVRNFVLIGEGDVLVYHSTACDVNGEILSHIATTTVTNQR